MNDVSMINSTSSSGASGGASEQAVALDQTMRTMGKAARAAAAELATQSTQAKNTALQAMADALLEQRNELLAANAEDMAAARERALESALVDRLELTDSRIDGMVNGLLQVAQLSDPVGEISDLKYQPSGIQVGKMRVPLGVIGMIYESRPNVTMEAASLCLKSGNAVILRGGSEAIASNRAIARCITSGLEAAGLPLATVQLVSTIDRAAVGLMLGMSDYIDVIVPRGGKGLIERVSTEATVPVIKHLDGVCHVYIDSHADCEKAISIAVNAKTQRYGTCNTMETLLVASELAAELLPEIGAQLSAAGVELRGCPATQAILPDCELAVDADWATEYLAPILSIRIVESVDQAIEHINCYGSRHTDSIVTEYLPNAQRFLRAVDSSSVMVNVSTRFADGFEYGLGAEIGISTDKLHARGPVGLEGLTSQKYIVLGEGQVRK